MVEGLGNKRTGKRKRTSNDEIAQEGKRERKRGMYDYTMGSKWIHPDAREARTMKIEASKATNDKNTAQTKQQGILHEEEQEIALRENFCSSDWK